MLHINKHVFLSSNFILLYGLPWFVFLVYFHLRDCLKLCMTAESIVTINTIKPMKTKQKI